MDVAPGVVTDGWFDLRPVLSAIPFPDVRGKRCLDIGTHDGFFAFELERRGASEVLAIDIADHLAWDWPPDARPASSDQLQGAAFDGHDKGDGFRLAARALDSTAEWRALSIYDLDPRDVGMFDVVVCGSLLLHLREPLRALEAVRSVCGGHFLSSEQIQPWLTLLGRRRPLAVLSGSGPECQWWRPNAAGHRQMLRAGGFDVVDASRPYTVRFNAHRRPPLRMPELGNALARWILTGSPAPGVLHRALLARPMP
jgi:tRNA (mo5U34)-methyltransferase